MRFFSLAPTEQLLRVALAFAFLYPPLAALADPYSWVGYFPTFLSDLVAPHQVILLHAFGVVEIVLAVWLLVGERIRIPALLMALTLLVIVLTNPAQFDVLFRDLSLAVCALVLGLRRSRPTAV